MISRCKDNKSYVIYVKNITNILGWWYDQNCFLRCKFSHDELPALLAKILQLCIVIKFLHKEFVVSDGGIEESILTAILSGPISSPAAHSVLRLQSSH